jgi:hypothetical protein
VWERDEHSTQVGADRSEIAPANLVDWQQRSHSFAGVVAYSVQDVALTGSGEPEEVNVASVTWSLFSLLGVRPLIGHTFSPRDSVPARDPVVILSESLWRRRWCCRPESLDARCRWPARTAWWFRSHPHRVRPSPRGVEVDAERTPTAMQPRRPVGAFLHAIVRLRPACACLTPRWS